MNKKHQGFYSTFEQKKKSIRDFTVLFKKKIQKYCKIPDEHPTEDKYPEKSTSITAAEYILLRVPVSSTYFLFICGFQVKTFFFNFKQSFQMSEYTASIDGLGCLRILDNTVKRKEKI